MILEFDWKEKRVTKAKDNHGKWFRLDGFCRRCGDCCGGLDKCKYFCYEIIEGKKIPKCELHDTEFMPYRCILYPRDPTERLGANCGYKWTKEE